MRDLFAVARECMEELDIIGVEYVTPDSWKINTRAEKRYGQCCQSNGKFSINITYRLLDERIPIEYLKNTIIHELVHTVEGCFNHGKKFQDIADYINDCYSCYHISTYVDKHVVIIVEEYYPSKRKERKSRYGIGCPKCGATWTYGRMCDKVQYPGNYRCGKCKVDIIRKW